MIRSLRALVVLVLAVALMGVAVPPASAAYKAGFLLVEGSLRLPTYPCPDEFCFGTWAGSVSGTLTGKHDGKNWRVSIHAVPVTPQSLAYRRNRVVPFLPKCPGVEMYMNGSFGGTTVEGNYGGVPITSVTGYLSTGGIGEPGPYGGFIEWALELVVGGTKRHVQGFDSEVNAFAGVLNAPGMATCTPPHPVVGGYRIVTQPT